MSVSWTLHSHFIRNDERSCGQRSGCGCFLITGGSGTMLFPMLPSIFFPGRCSFWFITSLKEGEVLHTLLNTGGGFSFTIMQWCLRVLVRKTKILYPFKTNTFLPGILFTKLIFIVPVIGSSFDSPECISSYTNPVKLGQTLSAPREISVFLMWSLISYLSRNEQLSSKAS